MFPELSSARFLLQQIVPTDQQFIFEGLSHPDVIKHYGVSFHSFESTNTQMQFYDQLLKEGTGIWWKIVRKDSNDRVGAIGFNNYQAQHRKAEIGYWLLSKYWKQGIIQETLPVVLDYLEKEVRVHRIEALIEDGNNASINLMRKIGFVYEGCMRDCEIKNGGYISLHIYSLINQ